MHGCQAAAAGYDDVADDGDYGFACDYYYDDYDVAAAFDFQSYCSAGTTKRSGYR